MLKLFCVETKAPTIGNIYVMDTQIYILFARSRYMYRCDAIFIFIFYLYTSHIYPRYYIYIYILYGFLFLVFSLSLSLLHLIFHLLDLFYRLAVLRIIHAHHIIIVRFQPDSRSLFCAPRSQCVSPSFSITTYRVCLFDLLRYTIYHTHTHVLIYFLHLFFTFAFVVVVVVIVFVFALISWFLFLSTIIDDVKITGKRR